MIPSGTDLIQLQALKLYIAQRCTNILKYCHVYITRFAKRGFIRAIINIEKSRFEILITVYLENAWCLVYEVLHQSIVIQGNSAGALFNGLLAELPTCLDSFFTSTTSDCIGVVGQGWWGATKWRGNTRCVVVLIL